MMQIFDIFPIIFMVWMTGFSGDSRGLRMGGFILLSIRWLAPIILIAVAGPFPGPEIARADFAVRSVLSLLFGAYLILWSVRSAQTVPIRIALAIAGLISLRLVFVLGMMTLAASGS